MTSFSRTLGPSGLQPLDTPSSGEPLKYWNSRHTPSPRSVVVAPFFPPNHIQDPTESENLCLLPKSASSCFTMAKDSCCTAAIFSIDSSKKLYKESSEAELSAFVQANGSESYQWIQLCCKPDSLPSDNNNMESSKSFLYFDSEIQQIKLLSLPVNHKIKWQSECTHSDTSETLGVLLVVVTKRAELIVQSILFSRTSASEQFQLSELIEVIHDKVRDGNALEMYASLDLSISPSGSQPILYIANSSESKPGIDPSGFPSRQSFQVDVLACRIVAHHNCPLFAFQIDSNDTPWTIRRLSALKGVERVRGICLSIHNSGSRSRCTVASLFQHELQIVSLPSLDTWKAQTLKPNNITHVKLSDSHPLGAALLVVPVNAPTEILREKATSRFAILCEPKRSNLDMSQHSGKARKSPALSPGVIQTSPNPVTIEKGGSPPQWTATETRNAVLRARRDLGNNSLPKEFQQKRHAANPMIQPLDESTVFDSSIATSDTDASHSVLPEESDVSIASPATAVLDMSERWIGQSPSDSIKSPLTGLSFLSEGDLPALATPLIKSTILHPRSRRSLQTPCLLRVSSDEMSQAEYLAHLIVVTVEHSCRRKQPSSTRTLVHSLAPDLSIFEAVSVTSSALLDPTIEIQSEQNSELMFSPSPGKRLTTSSMHEESPSPDFKLTLAVKPWATSKVRLLEFLLTEDSITQSDLGQPQDVDLFRLNNSNESTEIKSLHIEELSDEGHLRLRAVLATKVEDIISSKEGNIELTRGSAHSSGSEQAYRFIVASALIPLPGGSNEVRASNLIEPRKNYPVATKLDVTMNALQIFESNANDRLIEMERLLLDNSERISRLEHEISSSDNSERMSRLEQKISSSDNSERTSRLEQKVSRSEISSVNIARLQRQIAKANNPERISRLERHTTRSEF